MRLRGGRQRQIDRHGGQAPNDSSVSEGDFW